MKKLIKLERMLSFVLAVLCLVLAADLYRVREQNRTFTDQKAGTKLYREKNLTEESGQLPSFYNVRDHGKQPIVKNQGGFGTCWAVAASSALESRLLPEEELVFSADHISMQNSFARTQNDGGDYTMVMAYLAGWQGPVTEEQDPYGDGKSESGLPAVKHVQEMQILKDRDLNGIKQAVYTYGAVQSSVYMDLENAFSSSVYYNQLENSYYYPGEKTANHDVLIIGWDDRYPAENFNYKTENDGAFICQNSWGSDFGEDGVFYISYDDINIGKETIVYTVVENTDNYDYMEETDLCGWVGQLGYGDETCYFANVFEASELSRIRAVGFYATGQDTQYRVMVLKGDRPLSDALMEPEKAAGRIANAGFYTIPLEEAVEVEAGEKYTVVIWIQTPEAQYPVATEYPADDTTANAVLSDGDGYISHNGVIWSGTESDYGCNVCMKVYADVIR